MTTGSKAEVLAWVNGLREELGKPTLAELPCGSPKDAWSCVIAVALGGAEVSPSEDEETEAQWGIVGYGCGPLPAVVNRFAIDFDNGEVPRADRGAG